MALGARLDAGHQTDENLALLLQRLVEGQLDGVAYGLGAGNRRLEPAGLLGCLGYRLFEACHVAACGLDLLVAVADRHMRPAFGRFPAGEGNGFRNKVVFSNGVHRPDFQGFGGADRRA